MKKIFLILLASSFGLMMSCEQQNNLDNGNAGMSAQPGLKMAYVNNDTLFTYYERFEAKMNDLQGKLKKSEKQMQVRANKLQKEVQNFQQRAQAGLMSQNDIQIKEMELLQKRTELQNSQQAQAQGIMAEEQAITKEVYEEITAFLEEYNETKEYDFVLGYTAGANIWLANDALDITQVVLDSLNNRYERSIKKDEATQ